MVNRFDFAVNRCSKGINLSSILFFSFFFLVRGLAQADTVAVFYALEADAKSLLLAAGGTASSPPPVGSRPISRLRINQHEVIAVLMGSGAVESALSAQAVLTKYSCDLAISVGPAGSIDGLASTGEWYRVDRVIAWHKGSETTTGFQLHQNSAYELTRDVQPTPDPGSGVGKTWRWATLASGESFIASAAKRERLRTATGAHLVDMNSHGLAAACTDHGVPLVILRVVSDRADEQAGETFRAFVESYDGQGGRIVARLIENLPANPASPEQYDAIRNLMRE